MTKPNDFILNSDYLSLAQTSRTEFTANFAAASFTPGVPFEKTEDFNVPSSPGAIDMCLISLNGSDYHVGSWLDLSSIYPNPQVSVYLTVYRINATTMQVRLHGFTSYSGGYNLPAQTLKIKVSSFKPPNIF